MNVQSCLTNPKDFCDDMTAFMSVGKAVDVVHINFSKEFEFTPVSYNVITIWWKYGCVSGQQSG